MSQYKSPLRYPGGKSRVAKYIAKFFSDNISKIASPFFGGGSVEFELMKQGKFVIASDIFVPLTAFWQQLQSDPKALALQCQKYLSVPDKSIFVEMQCELRSLLNSNNPSQFEMAWRFFCINRRSFSGTTLSGGFNAGQRFTPSSIERLLQCNLSSLSITSGDYWSILSKVDTYDAIYADPPYLLNSSTLYGDRGSTHKSFDHYRLSDHLHSLTDKLIVLSYNDHPEIRELYKDWHIEPLSYAYGMNKTKKSNEIIIINDCSDK